jgi:hypothetical protein
MLRLLILLTPMYGLRLPMLTIGDRRTAIRMTSVR